MYICLLQKSIISVKKIQLLKSQLCNYKIYNVMLIWKVAVTKSNSITLKIY